ncbi:MAG TPA: hypothetical protein VIM65_21460 [Cyclobacteriaceae bacterium]
MKFTSLQEYFYKLQNALYMLILLPLLAFIFLIASPPDKMVILSTEDMIVVIGGLTGFAIADGLIVSLIFYQSMKKIRKAVLLSEKLDRYYNIAVIRYAVITMSCLVMAFGYYLTDHIIFISLFALTLILFFILWPRPSTVCRQLKLKGDEREMVLYKKDRF